MPSSIPRLLVSLSPCLLISLSPCLPLSLSPCLLVLAAAKEPETTVGLPVQIEGLVLPGSELEVKPLTDRRAPVVLRIVNVWPHGSAFRYDLEYYALEPGKFDLKDYLRRKDKSSLADLPAIPVEAHSVLPAGQIKPNDLQPNGVPRLGGYRLILLAAAVAWVFGLATILLVGRRKKIAEHARVKPRTLAEHLRPLVEGAMAGRLAPAELAELERSLLVYWERRLNLHGVKPAEAIAKLRGHPDAGPLLQRLEEWLHRPGAADDTDVATLLKPYQEIPADAVELAARA
jgi:hypothetical protein